mgnify:CR=1 FL=1
MFVLLLDVLLLVIAVTVVVVAFVVVGCVAIVVRSLIVFILKHQLHEGPRGLLLVGFSDGELLVTEGHELFALQRLLELLRLSQHRRLGHQLLNAHCGVLARGHVTIGTGCTGASL